MTTKPTALERVAGHPITEVAATLIAGAGATVTPYAALLPVLTTCLAGQRQQKRNEEALNQITLVLKRQEGQLQKISDEQYHVLVEAISATFQTINPEKLSYLQRAIENSLTIEGLVSQESAVLARIIRDISAEEADFIFKNFSFKYIHVSDSPNDKDETLKVPRNSRDSLIVLGLETLGVLEFGLGTMGDGNMLSFSNSTAKLFTLLKPQHQPSA